MELAIPMLSAFDPAAGSEGTLDPLGLYQIADQLATKLVPGVRERMQRIRFLTAMSVGALITEGVEGDPDQPECSPSLVWEWLVVESFIRAIDDDSLWGVPGTLVTRRALKSPGYLDSRCYLKTPRIFGFHGVYKRLAVHLGLVDVHMNVRPEGERLADAWLKDRGKGGLRSGQPLLQRWQDVLRRSLDSRPCRTRPNGPVWTEIAEAFRPDDAGRSEKRTIKKMLHAGGDRSLGLLPEIWKLQQEFSVDGYAEEPLQKRLRETTPSATALLDAIAAYESFCRSLQDAFDLMRVEAGRKDVLGLVVSTMGSAPDFVESITLLDERYGTARQRLAEVDPKMAGLFDERFSRFATATDNSDVAVLLCEHHLAVQKGKSAAGKRSWFERFGPDRIYMRHRYRIPEHETRPGRFVHSYRGYPIRNFYRDLC